MKKTDVQARSFLRHALATLAYRGGKAIRGAPASFGDYRANPTGNSPAVILKHIGDLLEWALRIAKGDQQWREAKPIPWEEESRRFFSSLSALDEYLESDAPLSFPPQQIFQGAVADALTHVGQIAMLRRLSGSPMKAESYFLADIVMGRVGPEQTPAKLEFD
jgi:hypothetical protein